MAPEFNSIYKPRAKVLALLPMVDATPELSNAKGARKGMQSPSPETAVVRDAIFHELERQKHKYSVEIQDLAKTDSLLEAASVPRETVASRPAQELCGLLGVDAVLRGGLTRWEKAGLTREKLAGLSKTDVLSTEVRADVAIYDGVDGNLVWQMNLNASDMFSSPAKGARNIGRDVAKKFPYRKP